MCISSIHTMAKSYLFRTALIPIQKLWNGRMSLLLACLKLHCNKFFNKKLLQMTPQGEVQIKTNLFCGAVLGAQTRAWRWGKSGKMHMGRFLKRQLFRKTRKKHNLPWSYNTLKKFPKLHLSSWYHCSRRRRSSNPSLHFSKSLKKTLWWAMRKKLRENRSNR